MGAVISREAADKIRAQIKKLCDAGVATIAYQKEIAPSPSGFDVAPTVLVATEKFWTDPALQHMLLHEEIFGPVMTVVAYDNIADVHALKSKGSYGLTGAYFSDDPVKLAKGMMWLPAGNAYGNRRSSGATGPEAFGGNGGTMSSYNDGLKGFDECPLYYDLKTHSSFYGSNWDAVERRRHVETLREHSVIVRAK